MCFHLNFNEDKVAGKNFNASFFKLDRCMHRVKSLSVIIYCVLSNSCELLKRERLQHYLFFACLSFEQSYL